MSNGKYSKNCGHCNFGRIVRSGNKKAGSGNRLGFKYKCRGDYTLFSIALIKELTSVGRKLIRDSANISGCFEAGDKNHRDCRHNENNCRNMQRRKRGGCSLLCGNCRRRRRFAGVYSVDGKRTRDAHRTFIRRVSVSLIVSLVLLAGQSFAVQTEEILESQADILDLNALRQAAGEFAPDIDWVTENANFNGELLELLEVGNEAFGGVLKKAIRSGVLLLVIVILTGFADSSVGVLGQGTRFSVPMASALAITAVAVSDANALIGLGNDVIENMEQFSKVLLPAVAAVTSASGAPGTAAAKQLAAMLFSDILITLINRLLLPLVYVYIAACAAYSAVGNEGLKRIASTLKWLVTLILTTVLLAFVGYLTIGGVIAKSSDAVALKVTKFTVSTIVPVVGGILSDAAETVLAGAGILKNTVGVFGMLVVIGMCVLPFIELGIHYIVYKIAAALSATITEARTAGLIDGIGGAFGLVLGMTGSCALLLLISLVSAVMVVNT